MKVLQLSLFVISILLVFKRDYGLRYLHKSAGNLLEFTASCDSTTEQVTWFYSGLLIINDTSRHRYHEQVNGGCNFHIVNASVQDSGTYVAVRHHGNSNFTSDSIELIVHAPCEIENPCSAEGFIGATCVATDAVNHQCVCSPCPDPIGQQQLPNCMCGPFTCEHSDPCVYWFREQRNWQQDDSTGYISCPAQYGYVCLRIFCEQDVGGTTVYGTYDWPNDQCVFPP